MEQPVLLIGFNRPEPARRVFAAIREARPPRLYLAVDGPRADRPGEVGRTLAVRALADDVDWPCEVKVLAQERNLGCRRGVVAGLNWFFEHEEEGIILEDDCVPTQSFFRYTAELLDRFRDDHQIAEIGGSSFIRNPSASSYYFSRMPDIWGWATWRRAWSLYDGDMAGWPAWRDAGGLASLAGSTPGFVQVWTHLLDQTYAGEIDTWDFQWVFTCWKNGLTTVLPQHTQIRNIGFDADATHTLQEVPSYVTQPRPLDFPLVHPVDRTIDPKLERAIVRERNGIGLRTDVAAWLEQVPLAGRVVTAVRRLRAAG